MDSTEYRKRGREIVDYIADYLENIRERRVYPDVKPGYLSQLLPDSAPFEGESWDAIFRDFDNAIMPGVTHWKSPHMHAYFPALSSYPSLLGDMLADAVNQIGFTWASSPACTELETIVMDWLGKMIGLPSDFLHVNQETMGGGVIMTTASESTYTCMLAARTDAIRRHRYADPDDDSTDSILNDRLVGYCSEQAHSSVEKCGIIGLVRMRLLPTDEKLALRGKTLREAIISDREEGLIPFFVCATLGTTGACAFDNLKELGPICHEENVWLHIDAAYAGTAFVCPEFRKFLTGVEFANSFAFNPSKWMMVHFDCTALWVKNSKLLHRTFNVEPLYLKHENSGAAIDYMHWQIGLSRRFRSLKLWCVIRSYGVSGLQKHVRESVRMAKLFEMLIRSDDRFEIPADRHMGLVVFRLKGDNQLTELLLKKINKTGQVHMVPAALKGKYVIRFTVTSQDTTQDDIARDWAIIRDATNAMMGKRAPPDNSLSEKQVEQTTTTTMPATPRQTICKNPLDMKKSEFGLSLILSNVPMSPRFVNGSFAAVFDNSEILFEFAKFLSERGFQDQSMVLSPRRKLRHGNKQYSLDTNLLSGSSKIYRSALSAGHQASFDSKIDKLFENSPLVEEKPEQAAAATVGMTTAPDDEIDRCSDRSSLDGECVADSDPNKEKMAETKEVDEKLVICGNCGHHITLF
ncbi:aromatic-L-amino-acid decarboxylase-like [Tubulanus polymorphus]|uniref:aromatic-L-amino-acid decarboxylase-like n=1 Tax=Tubulanus polymorphus TaxID=672921 RepID=UPI003DA1EC4A